MKLKSITLTTGIFPPDIGGPASFIPMFAELLSKKGVHVTVITLADKPKNDDILDYKVVRINRKMKKPLRMVFVIKEIMKAAKTSNLIFSNTLAFESAIAAKLIRKKLVQKFVGDIAWERANVSGRFLGTFEEYQEAKLDLRSKLTNFYRNFGINLSDMIITPSYYLKNFVAHLNYPENQIKVIYNAVEFENSNRAYMKTKYRILSIARLIPCKGIEAIIRAISKLDFDFEYILIGDGPLREYLEYQAKDLNVDIKFKGNISKKEVANWLRSSDLFLLNSSYEGLPHVVLEAMANGCPIIASAVGGTPEIVEDMKNGMLVEYNNIEQIVEKINLIKNNFQLRKYLVNNAKRFVQKFADINKMVDKYIMFLEEML